MSKLCLQQSLAATGLGAVVNRLQNVLADPRDKCPKQTKATLPIDGPAVFGIRSHHFNTKNATTHCSLRARLNHVCSKCSRRVVKKWIHNGILLEELLYSFNLKVLWLCGVSEFQRQFHLVDDQEEESKGQIQQTIDFNSNSTDFNSLKFEISADMQQNTQLEYSTSHLRLLQINPASWALCTLPSSEETSPRCSKRAFARIQVQPHQDLISTDI